MKDVSTMLRLILALLAGLMLAASAAAAPKGLTQDQAWFYVERNVSKGPCAAFEMVELAADGVIRPSTQVFEPGRGWAFAKDVPLLQPHFGVAPRPAAGPAEAAPRRPRPQFSVEAPPVGGAYIENPNAPAAAGAAWQREIGTYLAGTWRPQSTQTVLGVVIEASADFVFRPDGGYETAVPAGSGRSAPHDGVTGIWRIQALSPERFVLILLDREGRAIEEKTLDIEDADTMRVIEDGVILRRVR